ncbi:MAG: ATP-binding protein, partial [Leptospirales bacterium]|nr:ATP-binding protein [Leptospirales bacterium]
RGDFSVRLDENFELCRAFNSMLDSIEERERAQKEIARGQIVQSEKMAAIGRLSSGIAHELNSPLTGILTYSTIMLDEMKNTKHEQDIAIIINEAIRCRDIVRGLLDFSRESHPELHPFSLNHLIIDTVSILEKTYGLRNIIIEKHLADEILLAKMDVNQMKSVLNNLLINAVDAMPNGGVMKIRTGLNEKAKKFFMEIEDNGIGIKKENIGLIFDPFFTDKKFGKGTGLGLFIAYNIVERHNGTIRVESEEGSGTTFIVELPAS